MLFYNWDHEDKIRLVLGINFLNGLILILCNSQKDYQIYLESIWSFILFSTILKKKYKEIYISHPQR